MAESPSTKRNREAEAAFVALVLAAYTSAGGGAGDGDAALAYLTANAPDLLDAIAAQIADAFGVEAGTILGDSVLPDFLARVGGYITSYDGTDPLGYVRLVVENELHNVEIELVQAAVSDSGGIEYIERVLGESQSGPCPECEAVAGVHPADDPALYYSHPWCVCEWLPWDGPPPEKHGGVLMELETKTFDLAELSLKGGDSDPGEIEGYGAVFGNWDRQKDKILPGAFTNTLPSLLKDGFMSWGHDLHSPPIASFSELHEDGKGLYFRAQFHSTPEAQAARRVAQERIERGKSMGCSITYGIKQKEHVREGRLLKELVVPEICLTPIPANQLANATGVKAVLSEATGYAPQAVRMHEAFTGTHTHEHSAMGSQGGDAMHMHSHTHNGDANHDHAHTGGKASGIACPFCSGQDTTNEAACQCNMDCGVEGCPKGANDAADDAGKSNEQGNKAVWSSGYVTSLPDSAFACVDGSGRHYPHHDKSGAVDDAHLKAALSRIGDSSNTQCGKAHLEAHAKAEGIGDYGKNHEHADETKTFAEQSYTALAAVEDFLSRAHSLAELRGKVGRTISASNRARLSDLKDQLMACCDSIDEVMAMGDSGAMPPPGKTVDATAEYMDLQRILARGYGVPV